MRRRVEALALGIRRSALGPVFALSGLTVRESVRKKIFLILAVFTFAMLGATLMLPSLRPEDRVPLIQTWAQRGITFFGVLLAVFLAGVSLPEDIEERKIFTLLTKPMSRWQLLAGRFWGFALLLAAFALTRAPSPRFSSASSRTGRAGRSPTRLNSPPAKRASRKKTAPRR